ncbi:hypothetical protein H072_7387 [Dactylellina haptotyla CBS 200.50]|uniref:Uncharacterized protein n=1 Tax=Dactylellina haptotyla (strain CBS 200.50) TaxID=1284197 RepID=S8ACQ6_DACHA|nr:hypothetical protein H072_7387 [Dactylellina haptotyla CBS 200.50]
MSAASAAPPVPARHGSSIPPELSSVARRNTGSIAENSLAGASNSHERAEHPSDGAASLRLETAVRFSGVFVETEDMVAAALYWRSRQEHVEADDFYKFMAGHGKRETELLLPSGLGTTENTSVEPRPGVAVEVSEMARKLESVLKDQGKGNRAIESTSIASTIISRAETAVAAKRKPPPPPPPPRSRTGIVNLTVPFGASGLAGPSIPSAVSLNAPLSPPIIPPKLTSIEPPFVQWAHKSDAPSPPRYGAFRGFPKGNSATDGVPPAGSYTQNSTHSPTGTQPPSHDADNDDLEFRLAIQASLKLSQKQAAAEAAAKERAERTAAADMEDPEYRLALEASKYEAEQSALRNRSPPENNPKLPQPTGFANSDLDHTKNNPYSIPQTPLEHAQAASSLGIDLDQYMKMYTHFLTSYNNSLGISGFGAPTSLNNGGTVSNFVGDIKAIQDDYLKRYMATIGATSGYPATGTTQNPYLDFLKIIGLGSTNSFLNTQPLSQWGMEGSQFKNGPELPKTDFSGLNHHGIQPNNLPPYPSSSGSDLTAPLAHAPVPPTPGQSSVPQERLELRRIMLQMAASGLGSRSATKLGLEYVMNFWTLVPTRYSVTDAHLKEMMDNFNKPHGRGLAEMTQGFSFMHMCIRLSKLDLIKELVEYGDADLSAIHPKSTTLLRNAIWYSDEESGVLQYLISRGLDVNGRTLRDSVPPLHHAVAAHNVSAVRDLLNAGAKVNNTVTKNRRDLAAICRKKSAAVEPMYGILFLLLDAGGEVISRSTGTLTATLFTAASGFPEIIEVLKAKGADHTDLKRLEEFELSAAIIYNDIEFVKEHIRKKKPLNRKDIFNCLPLDNAYIHNRLKIASVLKAAGATSSSATQSSRSSASKNVASSEDFFDIDDSDKWSVDGQGDRSDPEDYQTGKDFRVGRLGGGYFNI